MAEDTAIRLEALRRSAEERNLSPDQRDLAGAVALYQHILPMIMEVRRYWLEKTPTPVDRHAPGLTPGARS